MQDTTHTIVRSAARFFSGTMISRVTGLMRDMSMAYAFGTKGSVAALLVAFRFAHLLRRLFGEGALQTAFIPHFEELRKENPERAGLFFRDLAFTLTLSLTLIIAIIMIVLTLLGILVDFSPGNAEILFLTVLMMPSLLFICLFGINASLLQCEKSYFAPSAAPAAFNLIWIGGVFITANFATTSSMSWLACFVVVACFSQWAITLPKTYAILKGYQIKSLRHHVNCFSTDVLKLSKPLMLGILGVAASQINNAFDAVFARWADIEGPAFLWYAIRLQQLPLALFGIALSGALLPPLARAIKNGDHTKYLRFFNFAIKQTSMFMLPLTAILFLMGDRCINLIYGRGDFTGESVVETTWALWGYSIGLLPMALILILAPAFYAKGNFRTPSLAASGSMIVNVVLNSLFIGVFAFGATSVAAATSISAWFNCLWLTTRLSKDQGSFMSKDLMTGTAKVTLATGLASAGTLALNLIVSAAFSPFQILSGITPDYPKHFFLQLMDVATNGMMFITVFALAAFLLNLTPKRLQQIDFDKAKSSDI